MDVLRVQRRAMRDVLRRHVLRLRLLLLLQHVVVLFASLGRRVTLHLRRLRTLGRGGAARRVAVRWRRVSHHAIIPLRQILLRGRHVFGGRGHIIGIVHVLLRDRMHILVRHVVAGISAVVMLLLLLVVVVVISLLLLRIRYAFLLLRGNLRNYRGLRWWLLLLHRGRRRSLLHVILRRATCLCLFVVVRFSAAASIVVTRVLCGLSLLTLS